MTTTTEQLRWTVTRTRRGEGAPSLSLSYVGASERAAFQAHIAEHQEAEGTTIHVRPRGADRREFTAAFKRTALGWEQTYGAQLPTGLTIGEVL